MRDTLLNGRLVLHGVDVEHVARATLTRRPSSIRRSQVGHLTEDQRERLLSYLIIVGWQLSERYDPERPDAIPFGHMLTKVMRCRVVDWLRKEYGDNRKARARGERHASNHPTVVSLDELVAAEQWDTEPEHTQAVSIRVGDTLATSAMDPAEHCDPDIERLLGNRNIESFGHQPNESQGSYAAAA